MLSAWSPSKYPADSTLVLGDKAHGDGEDVGDVPQKQSVPSHLGGCLGNLRNFLTPTGGFSKL